MQTNIDYGSLLNDYYFELDRNYNELVENVITAIRWQLVDQTRDLNEEGNDTYERYRFISFKKNFFNGTMEHETEWSTSPVFQNGRYISARYARLTDE